MKRRNNNNGTISGFINNLIKDPTSLALVAGSIAVGYFAAQHFAVPNILRTTPSATSGQMKRDPAIVVPPQSLAGPPYMAASNDDVTASEQNEFIEDFNKSGEYGGQPYPPPPPMPPNNLPETAEPFEKWRPDPQRSPPYPEKQQAYFDSVITGDGVISPHHEYVTPSVPSNSGNALGLEDNNEVVEVVDYEGY